MKQRAPIALEHTATGLSTIIKRPPMRPAPKGRLLPFSWVPIEAIGAIHRRFVTRHVDRIAAELGIGQVLVRFYEPTRNGAPVSEVDFWHGPTTFDDYVLGGMAHLANLADVQVIEDGRPVATPNGPVGEIALLRGLRGTALVDVIAHEMRHLWQYSGAMADADREADAERFAADYTRRLKVA